MEKNNECSCSNEQKTILIYSCSGGANTGNCADKVARKLAKDKFGNISCLAAIGAEISGFIESAKAAYANIVIDGCPVKCGKRILEKLGLHYNSYIITEMGVVKGITKITDELVEQIAENIKEGEIKYV